MNGAIKRYLPYVIIIFGIFLLIPLIFANKALENYSAVVYYFIFLATTIISAAVYCSKHGLDFLFALIAPVAFLFSMMIYNNGFAKPTNFILLAVYLVAGIFGLFLGDLAFGDERRKREQEEKAAAEEVLLNAKRRDELENQKRKKQTPSTQGKSVVKTESTADFDSDDFDYDSYLAEIDRKYLNDEDY